jgi:aspartyl protease family protein
MRWGTLGILAFWLVVMAGLYVAMERVRQPRAAVVAADGALIIPRGSDGHFHVAGRINGQPVAFMVDTGASLIAVTDALAQQAGLTGGEVTQFRTANGLRQGRTVVTQSVVVGPFVVSGLRVGTGYTGEAMGDALLGQNFLQHFDVQMQRDRMVLRPHP